MSELFELFGADEQFLSTPFDMTFGASILDCLFDEESEKTEERTEASVMSPFDVHAPRIEDSIGSASPAPFFMPAAVWDTPAYVPKHTTEALFAMSDSSFLSLMEEKFVMFPTESQAASVDPTNLFLRWITEPPARVNATSPSQLTRSQKPGTPFSFSLQLVARTMDEKFIPYKAMDDIRLSANIYGIRKSKTNNKCSNSIENQDLVLLETNPIGNPLLLLDGSPVISSLIKQNESVATFEGVSLSCGSNAARSQSAPLASRDWDWDYYMKVEATSTNSQVRIRSVLSNMITTDSNRSQTRENRKRSLDNNYCSLPDAKKQRTSGMCSPFVNTFPLSDQSQQPFPLFSHFYEFSAPSFKCRT